MMQSVRFTHKGWFMCCPVKVADPFGEAPVLAARWWWLDPWFIVNEALQGLLINVVSLVDPDYEPMWMIRLTGELPKEK